MVNSIIPSSPSQDSPINTGHFQTDASTKQTHQPNRRINFVMKRKAEDERGKEKKKEKEEPNYGLQADPLGHIRCQCYKTFNIRDL
jgi:hypothetical protein